MRVAVISLGCAKNLVDTEVLLGKLVKGGAKLVNDPSKADVIIVNTCGFIQQAKEEAIDTILDWADGKRKVVVMGCLVERYREEMKKEFPEVSAFFGTESWDQIIQYLGLKEVKSSERVLTTPPSYAYLKVAEGCNRTCSFCAIPLIRGRHRSKPLEDLLEEARNLAERGVKELCIVSQDTGYYGKDLYHRKALVQLLKKLEELEGIEWIRLLYLYPTDIDEELLSYLKDSGKVLPYLDIPLQHVSDRVLKSMRRGYSGSFVRRLLDEVMKNLDNVVLRTTFLVGYPEEREEDFRELLRFVEEGYFHWVGVFTYSHEENTPAYPLGDPIPQDEKELRRDAIMKAQQEITFRKNAQLVGREMDLLVDGYDEELGIVPVGRVYLQAPEVDGICYVEADRPISPGEKLKVKVTEAVGYDLKVEVC